MENLLNSDSSIDIKTYLASTRSQPALANTPIANMKKNPHYQTHMNSVKNISKRYDTTFPIGGTI